MMDPILIYSPMPLSSQQGNAVTALRLAHGLTAQEIPAVAVDAVPDGAVSTIVVLNAWRSAPVVQRLRARESQTRIIILLTGTDIFPRADTHPETLAALELADAIVAFHPGMSAQLPASCLAKTRHILPAVAAAMTIDVASRRAARPDPWRCLVSGHLRPVKDPFLTAAAVEHLGETAGWRVEHYGAALTEDMATAAAAWMQRCPAYRWWGNSPHGDLLARMAEADVTVNSSTIEGAANVVMESIVRGVPVLASRIPGNEGLLGVDWDGYFTSGSATELAGLMQRCRTDAPFFAHLAARARELAPSFHPEREALAWAQLILEGATGN